MTSKPQPHNSEAYQLEALQMAYAIGEMVETHLGNHHFCAGNPALRELSDQAVEIIGDLYQAIENAESVKWELTMAKEPTETTAEAPRNLLDGNKAFCFGFYQTPQRDHHKVFEGNDCADQADKWSQEQVTKGHTVFIWTPSKMQTPVEETQLDFSKK